MTEVVVERVEKRYHAAQPVLRGVDLVAPDGAVTVVLGESGSGKTTLLRLVAGFERADAGSIRLGGRAVDTGADSGTGRGGFVPPQRRRVAFVPQDAGLFPHLSVRGNVAFGARGADRRKRVEELLDMVGLDRLAQRRPHELSGGQQQRVALARALASGAEVVLLDEPFSSLDAALRSRVRSEAIALLRETGRTGIVVTHDHDEALTLGDRLVVLADGAVAGEGTPAELYRTPPNRTVASAIGIANLVRLGDAELLVRPEQLVLLADAEPGCLTGTVVASEFQGHSTLVTVRPEAGGEPLVCRDPGWSRPEPGTRVWLRVVRDASPVAR